MEAQLRQLAAQLKAYEQQVKAAADRVLAEHANEVAQLAKELAPVKTGKLRDSIQVVRDGDLHYKVEATAPYAADVELGTANMEAEPFLFPASEQLRNELPGKLKAALKNT
jgi:HK97 gp10 family phage protein